MIRDMELVRKILLNIERGDLRGGVEGHDIDAVNYHKALLIQANLVEGTPRYSSSGQKPSDIPIGVMIKRMTWQGHDFIDAIANDTKWEAGKDLTIETIKFGAQQLFGIAS